MVNVQNECGIISGLLPNIFMQITIEILGKLFSEGGSECLTIQTKCWEYDFPHESNFCESGMMKKCRERKDKKKKEEKKLMR